MPGLGVFLGIKVDNIKPQVDRLAFPGRHGVIVFASGRWLNFGCATERPSFVMSCLFTKQLKGDEGLQARRLLGAEGLRREVASLYLPACGAEMTKLMKAQAAHSRAIPTMIERPLALSMACLLRPSGPWRLCGPSRPHTLW